MVLSSAVKNTSTTSQKDTTAPTVDQNALFHAINSATLDRVQSVLREVCSKIPEASKLASEKLLVSDSDGGSSAGVKRKREQRVTQQRYEICEQCEQEYDVSENYEGACVWHSGEFSYCSNPQSCTLGTAY
jgi:hypothetical protein